MAQLPMQLSSKLVLVIILIPGLISGKYASFNSAESTEDVDLKQALFLVNLLKSEYVKVLRENINLKTPSDDPGEEDNSTCPTTVNGPSLSVSTLRWADVTKFSGTQAESTSPKSLLALSPRSPSSPRQAQLRVNPTNTENLIQPYKYVGRRMMSEDTNKYGKLRRLDYDDPFGDHPEETEKPKVSTTVRTTVSSHKGNALLEKSTPSPSSSTVFGQAETAPSTAQQSLAKDPAGAFSGPKVSDRNPMVKIYGIRPTQTTTMTGTTLRPRKIKIYATIPSITESNNVMSQVASELMNEFKEVKNEKLKQGLGKLWSENTETPHFLKSTKKIYLEGSSRYPIPLPENHAFCHTNPYNSLCRTFIG